MGIKIKKILIQIASCILALVIVIGCWALGFISGKSLAWSYVGAALFILLVVVICINLALTASMQKKMNNLSPKDGFEMGIKYKNSVEEDPKKVEKKVETVIKISYLYLALLIIICAVTAYCVGRFDIESGGFIFLAVLLTFVVWGLLDVLFAPIVAVNYPEQSILNEKDYPALYKTVYAAAEKAGFSGKIVIYLLQTGISICSRNNIAYITVEPEIFNILTKNELYAVMLHEFAHFRNKDTARGDWFETIGQRWNGDNTINPIISISRIMFISFAGMKIAFFTAMLQFLTSREREIKADKFVIENNEAKNYVNATAKSSLYLMYQSISWRETNYDTYESETVCDNYTEININNFKNKLEQYKEKWFFTLENELPAFVDTHPTFKMRMEAMGEKSFDISQIETDEKYCDEQAKSIKAMDKQIVESFDQKGAVPYEQCRKANYLDRKAVIEKYESITKEEKLSVAQRLECVEAFYNIDNTKAKEILQSVLSEDANSGVANFYMGVICADEYNDRCVDYFYKAISDPTYSEGAIDGVGKYALKIGNKELLEEYRAKVIEIKQKAVDKIKDIAIKRKDKFYALDMSDEKMRTVCEDVKGYFLDKVKTINAAYIEKNGQKVFCFALTFVPKIDYNAAIAAYNECNAYFGRLSSDNEKYFMYFPGTFEYYKIIKVKNSEIYKKS